MDKKYTQAFEQIGQSATKLQAICKLAIDMPDDNKPDLQTMMYVIQDYVKDIKNISEIMV